MTSRWWLLFSLFAVSSANARSLAPDDFAFGMEVTLGAGAALAEVTLPPDVYRAVTRADLGDVRVFNAAGEVVPHVLRAPPPPAPARALHTPPLFPIYASEGQAIDAVVMSVQRDAQGRIARIETRSQRQGKREGRRRIVAYVADASALKAPLAALEFDWGGSSASFLGTVTLQASDDLTRWTTVVADAGVARLEFGGEQLERRRVEFPPQRAKYYRVVWPADKPLPELPVIAFEEVARAAAPTRSWENVVLTRATQPGEYTFASPGRFPFDRARVQLSPQTNRVVHATLQAREQSQDSWSARGGGSVYVLKFGTVTLESQELVVSTASDGEWMLRLTPAEGLENVEAAVEFGWVPHRLVFVASGAGPFRLAYGSASVTRADGPLGGVLADVEKNGPQSAVSVATLGSPVTLGGPERLSSSPTANWRTWVLWGVLIVAVGLLGWMAWRLGRRMTAAPGSTGPEKPQPPDG